MKLLLLSFFSFGLCTLQKAFNEYSQLHTISEQEFVGVQEFLSRVQAANSEELVSKEDKEKLQELPFQSLVFSVFFPESLQNDPKEYSQVTWGDIDASCRRLETKCDENNVCKTVEHGMPFLKVLRLLYCFESVDSLSRDEFFDFFYLLDFLQGGKQRDLIVKMESLNNTLQSFISNSDLRYFAQRDESLKVLLAIWSPGTLFVDSDRLRLSFGEGIDVTLKKVLSRLATQSKSTSVFNLQKLEIHNISTNSMLTSLLEILESNAETLTCLSIHCFQFHCPQRILLPNVREISIQLWTAENCQIFFLLHSNYTVLEIGNNIHMTEISGKKYFQIASLPNINSLECLIKENKNLNSLQMNFNLSLDNEDSSHQNLKGAVYSLKDLKSFKLITNFIDLDGWFHPEIKLHSLSICGIGRMDWKGPAQKFPYLKNLSIRNLSQRNHKGFLKFISNCRLESLSLHFGYRFNREKGIQLISALSQLPSLKSFTLELGNNLEVQFRESDNGFQTVDIKLRPDQDWKSFVSTLSFGRNIKCLRISSFGNQGIIVTWQDIQALREKFPKLELLIVPQGSDIPFSIADDYFEVLIDEGESDGDTFKNAAFLAQDEE